MSQDNLTQEEIKEAIERDLPGWRLSEYKTPKRERDSNQNVRRVGDFDVLRKKYAVGQNNASVSPDPTSARVSKTILVQPKGGGEPKMADIIDGKIQIVQG